MLNVEVISSESLKLNYRQASDKIFDAYFKDEINPFEVRFCFCGTLCNNSDKWYGISGHQPNMARHLDFIGYTGKDFSKMEVALLLTISTSCGYMYGHRPNGVESRKYEDALFKGMCAALEVLRQIHVDRGENVDEEIPFKKRELLKV